MNADLRHATLLLFGVCLVACGTTARASAQEIDSRVQRYVDGIFQKYDTNSNGTIDADEMTQIPVSVQKWDSNGDGRMERQEALDYLQKRLNRRSKSDSVPNERQYGQKSADSSDDLDERIRKIVTEVLQQQAKPPKSQAQLQQELMAQMLGGRAGGNMFGNLSSVEPRRAKKTNDSIQLVDVAIQLAKIPAADTDKFDELAASLRESDFDTLDRGQWLRSDGNVRHLNRAGFTAVTGRTTRLTNGQQVPVVQGQMSNARGGGRVYQYQTYDVGLKLEVEPEVQGDKILLSLELAGSFLEEMGEDDSGLPKTKIETIECETVAAVSSGGVSVIRLDQDGELWILAVAARVNE